MIRISCAIFQLLIFHLSWCDKVQTSEIWPEQFLNCDELGASSQNIHTYAKYTPKSALKKFQSAPNVQLWPKWQEDALLFADFCLNSELNNFLPTCSNESNKIAQPKCDWIILPEKFCNETGVPFFVLRQNCGFNQDLMS